MADKSTTPIDLPELSSTPANPGSGYHRFYAKTDGKPYSKSAAGVEYSLYNEDQTITLTSDVTGSGTGSFATTIAANAVTLAKMADVATGTVFYRKTAATGDPEVQTLATLKTDLGLTGTNSGDQTTIVGITGTKAQFDAAVTDGNILYVGDVTTNATHTGDVTGATALTIANDAVTYAKMQNVSATDRLLGRSTAGSGDVEEIVCTAAGRALLDDADASAQRTTLGLGTLATQSGTFSGTSSGTNTGDNAVNTLYSGLVSNATHTGDATGSTALTVVRINGVALSGLATGILKNTTGTGVPSIATAADITGNLITGYSSGSGTVAATDTILQAINKLNGNDLLRVPYTGATTAVVLGANTLSTTSGVITPKVYPASNSTTAFQINKADGTTNVLNVDTTNSRVGIGTTTPGYSLTVAGQTSITGVSYGQSLLGQDNTAAPYYANIVLKATAANQDVALALECQRNAITQRWFFGAGSGGVPNTNNFRIYDLTNSVEAVNIAPSGNMGINTTAPGAKLHVVGTFLSQRLVEANTAGVGAPNVLLSAESGTILTNQGVAALNYHTLPTAATGLVFTFYVQDADGLRVTASAGDTIRINTAVSAIAGYAQSTAIGSSVTLCAINATEWVATSTIGTWTLT
jgi:hypothetical protein